jgi:hypothetical protein
LRCCGNITRVIIIAEKPRRNISSVIAGKAITEIDVSQKIEEYQLETARKKNKPNVYLAKPLVQSHHKHNTSPRREC